MTTDITELAQSHELLIANGQQTADLLRHLADNEIDSDYFAVVSECESYGQETDAELSITEFAIRAAGYVDDLVEALEKAQPAPVVPDELLKEYLRLVACMLSDYRNGNYGDAQRWIRHIAKASDVFEEKHSLSPWEMAKNII